MTTTSSSFRMARPCVSDLYFYVELLSSVGPKASDEWLQSSVLAQQPVGRSFSRNASSTCLPCPQERKSAESVDEHDFLASKSSKKEFLVSTGIHACTKSSICATPISSQDDDIFSLTSMDFELTAASTNLGLLFTDAAYLAFQKIPSSAMDCSK